jgi:hypothetical protein
MQQDSFTKAFDPPCSREPISSEVEVLRRAAGHTARQAIESTSISLRLYRAYQAGLCTRERMARELDRAIAAVDSLARSLRVLRDGVTDGAR